MGQKNSVESDESKPKDARTLLKKCFKNPMFSLVPYEIWRDLIASNADLQTIAIISQTCCAFMKLVDNIGENNFNLALMFRKEGQIALAKKYLQLCAQNNNSLAMFHLGYAYYLGGWGLAREFKTASELFRNSAELGSFHAVAHYTYCLRFGDAIKKNEELSNIWAKKALSSNNSYARGYCHFYGLGTPRDKDTAFRYLEASATEGDEFGQYFYGYCLSFSRETMEKSFYWSLKSAEQANYQAILHVCKCYRLGLGCEMDKILSEKWVKKITAQAVVVKQEK